MTPARPGRAFDEPLATRICCALARQMFEPDELERLLFPACAVDAFRGCQR